ncbi:acyl-CoA dehydrogenase [Alphaproteobacteria bacterium]|nr:acyl-CoA dehydrogenase [Alphaproteobacteria bacterium]
MLSSISFIESLSLLTSEIPYYNTIVIFIALFFIYNRLSSPFQFLWGALFFLKFNLSIVFWSSYIITAISFSIKFFRRYLVTKPIISIIKQLGLLPKISETEKIALTSGNTWIDSEIFSGRPNFNKIFKEKYPVLNDEEKSFLNNEVEEVCKMCVDYDVQLRRDLSPEVWKYLGDKKFFGMIIPKKYGGLGFSAYAHSCVVEKLASRSVVLAITTMVPNSLGPAELLLHYGTKDQQDYYLPRLAIGQELPCFALTEPTAGSDATSIISNGILFKDSDGIIKIRLNWNKRYITLGAYASLIGLAFQLRDPQRLMFSQEEVGITCALIPYNTPGVRQGRRHDPLATPFVNSPINGENVIITLDAIIGKEKGLGKGWQMLMECLSVGRGISLPATSSGGSKLVLRTVTAYGLIREQFGTPIAKFEGVEEIIARIASRTYALDAMRRFSAGAVDSGIKPAVIGAIAKYHSTEIFRQNINDGMDILGGSAIIRGPRNILANPYFSTPISITVEGSNVMTRSLIHFGQGSIMSHPYAFKEISALQNNDLVSFDKEFFNHVGHLFSNIIRAFLMSLTRGNFNIHPAHFFSKDLTVVYSKKIAWCSTIFAVLADIALARYGGNLKRKEKLNGRFGDALSAMYIAISILRKYEFNGKKPEECDIAKLALKEQLNKAQIAIDGIFQNIFLGIGKIFLKPFYHFSRINIFTTSAHDSLGKNVVSNLIKNSPQRDNLTAGIFINNDRLDNLGRLENAMKLSEEAQTANHKIKNAIKLKFLPNKPVNDLIELAFEKSIINLQEKHILTDARTAMLDAVQVDEYSLDDYHKI